MSKVSWGVLSTARIGVDKVIPAMQKGEFSKVDAIASRDPEKARAAAERLGIPKAYGSYDALLADKDIDAVYISLPNHLHVEWVIKSLEAGKHVLCEKPLGMNSDDAERLLLTARSFPHLKVMEAFMYRFHPQWERVLPLISDGSIGKLRYVHSMFSYYNTDATDIRNQEGIGGGGLLDVGCYCISFSRLMFGSEPRRVFGSVEYDPTFRVDRLVSGVLEFENGIASFVCSTQLEPHQHAEVFGTQGRVDIPFPFFPPGPDNRSRIIQQKGLERSEIVFDACNQYTLQGDRFSQAILNNTALPVQLEDALANMRVIDGIFESSQQKNWIAM